MMVFYIIIAVVVIFLVYGIISNYYFEVTNYDIDSKDIYDICGDRKIIVVSDLHNSKFGKGNKRLLKAIDIVNPYAIIIAGDMLNYKDSTNNLNAREFVLALLKKYKVIFSYGNHEQGIFYKETDEVIHCLKKDFDINMVLDLKEEYDKEAFFDYFFEGADKKLKDNFIYLANDSLEIGNVCVYGLRIHRDFFRRRKLPNFDVEYMTKLIGSANLQKTNVLIAHNPKYFEEYANWGADYVISGHLHGGFVRLPFVGGVISPQLRLFPKYSGGEYRYNDSHLILSRGLGMHTIKLRIFNAPELIVLSVKNR